MERTFFSAQLVWFSLPFLLRFLRLTVLGVSTGSTILRGVLILVGLLFAALLFPTPSHAQVSPSQYTSATRYDLLGRVTGVIGGDPDGAGVLGRVSERRSYDVDGRLVRVEAGVLAAWQLSVSMAATAEPPVASIGSVRNTRRSEMSAGSLL